MSQETITIEKEAVLSIQTSVTERQLLTQAAQARHTNINQFVLQASLAAAQTVLTAPVEFRLSPDQWEAFCERLDAPAQVIPAIRDLFSEPEPWG